MPLGLLSLIGMEGSVACGYVFVSPLKGCGSGDASHKGHEALLQIGLGNSEPTLVY
jgi:hypothetical protein